MIDLRRTQSNPMNFEGIFVFDVSIFVFPMPDLRPGAQLHALVMTIGIQYRDTIRVTIAVSNKTRSDQTILVLRGRSFQLLSRHTKAEESPKNPFHSPYSIHRNFQCRLHPSDPTTRRNVRKALPRDQYTRKIPQKEFVL